jgi:hypothetical protein
MKPRNREKDMDALARAFFANLQQGSYRGIGLSESRPFGNSDVAGDILELLDIEPANDEASYSESQRDYADELYGKLIDYLQAKYLGA